MKFIGNRIRVHDALANADGFLVEVLEATATPPVPATTYCIIVYDDFSFGITTLDKLTASK